MQSREPLIMDQQQSPFFRLLPQELRDEIYQDYVQEECGYSHDPTSETLRAADGNAAKTNFQYSCKRIAKEMDGMALRTNEIVFRTVRHSSDAGEPRSNAALFEELLRYYRMRLRHMLKWAHTTVSVEVMLTLKSLYPNSLAVQRMVETFKEGGDMDFQHGFVLKVWCLDDYHSGSILADLVTVMTTLPDFYYLTSKEYDLELRRATESDDDDNGPEDDDNDSEDDDSNHDDDESDPDDGDSDLDDGDSDLDDDEAFSSGSDSDDSSLDIPLIIRPPSYSKKTQTDILQWRPKLWSIPTRAELEAISEFLPPWPTASDRPYLDDDYVPNVYFSAATVAIRFLQRLSLENRQQLRKIVIQEDHPSVASPKIHGQGLLPFCLANPEVRIERRVDIWRTEFVYSSNCFDQHAKGIVMMIGTWINEVKILYQMGMPADCFTLVLHGPSEQASQQLSDAVIRAAIWLEGTVEIARREQRRFLPSEGITEDFVDVIKEMVRGEIPARFDAEMGEVWDIEKILSEHVGDWPSKVSDVFRLQDFDEPDGGWHAALEAYKEQV